MTVDANIYHQKFFQRTIKLEAPSAKAAVEVLINHFKPNTVIDVGCGCGAYLKEFEKMGVEIAGYDGSTVALEQSLVGDKIKLHDLSSPLVLSKKFDLCLCIEVAEHLETEYAETLIDTLTGLASTVFFTAATPGQAKGNQGHINEQRHSFWINLFKQKGFIYQAELSNKIRKEMKSRKIVWWVVKNLMIFIKK